MGRADLHIHTIYSWDGTCTVEAVLKQAAHIAGLDVIAITDHDDIQGALEAVELGPRYGIEVVPGCEISTADGHLLALFIQNKIPAGLSAVETVLRVQELGGLCIVPHLEAKHSQGLQTQVVRDALKDCRVQRTLLGMETFNAGLFDRSSNPKAVKLNQELKLAKDWFIRFSFELDHWLWYYFISRAFCWRFAYSNRTWNYSILSCQKHSICPDPAWLVERLLSAKSWLGGI